MRSQTAYFLILLWSAMVLQATFAVNALAIQKESQMEKEANLKQQAFGGLFNRWTFDEQKPAETLTDFSVLSLGKGPESAWTVMSDAEAPSPPNVLKAVSTCKDELCYRLLVANKLQYEYPDVSVRLRFASEDGAGGIAIGLKDAKQFYAAIVDLAAKRLEMIRVLDGHVTVLGHTAVVPKAVNWHSLRIQRNTIISKDFMEAFFDGALVLSVEDQTLGIGQVGLIVKGNSALDFDSLHAVPLFSHRPLSAPAAY